MKDKTQDKSKAHRRGRRFALYIIALGLLIAIVAYIWSLSQLPTIEERVAAIETARAIPDSENAAILYEQLFENPNAHWPDRTLTSLDADGWEFTLSRPWLEKDYPELADWIRDHRWLIDELLAASTLEKCHFPINIQPYRPVQVDRLRTMRRWVFLLNRAANNDVAEYRIDSSIVKWRCMIRLGRHLQQQCTLIEFLEGIGYEASALHRASDYIVEGNPDEHQLHKIASLPVETRDDWHTIQSRIIPVEELGRAKYKRSLGLVDRLKYEFGIGKIGMMKQTLCHRIHGKYLEMLARKRGLRILIALKRYQKQYHRWPDGLDAIKLRLSPEILVDPINDGEFVYRVTDDGFTLYSKGENTLDEGGQREKEGPDDRRIWP